MRARRPDQKGFLWIAVMAAFLLITAACTGASTDTTAGITTAPPDDGAETVREVAALGSAPTTNLSPDTAPASGSRNV